MWHAWLSYRLLLVAFIFAFLLDAIVSLVISIWEWIFQCNRCVNYLFPLYAVNCEENIAGIYRDCNCSDIFLIRWSLTILSQLTQSLKTHLLNTTVIDWYTILMQNKPRQTSQIYLSQFGNRLQMLTPLNIMWFRNIIFTIKTLWHQGKERQFPKSWQFFKGI